MPTQFEGASTTGLSIPREKLEATKYIRVRLIDTTPVHKNRGSKLVKWRSFARVGSIRIDDDFDETEKNKIAEEESGKWRIMAETKVKVSDKIRTEGVKLTKWFTLDLTRPREQKENFNIECLLELNFLNKRNAEEQKKKVSLFADKILKKFKEMWYLEALQKRRESLQIAISGAEAARRNFLIQNLYIHGPMSSAIPLLQIGSGWRGIRMWDKEGGGKSKAPYTWLITGQNETEFKVQHSTGFISDEVVVKLALVDRNTFDELAQSSNGTNPDAYTSQLSLSIDSPYYSAEEDNGYAVESSQDRGKSDDKT